jgi:hypothetical protein
LHQQNHKLSPLSFLLVEKYLVLRHELLRLSVRAFPQCSSLSVRFGRLGV